MSSRVLVAWSAHRGPYFLTCIRYPTLYPTIKSGIYYGSPEWEKWYKLLWLEIEAKRLVS